MKKNFSKTIMVILAVLLTLVLISTSTVSGIFAKYVIEKDATTIVSLKKFGVKLDLVQGANYTTEGAVMGVHPSFDGDDINVEVTVNMVPGDDYKEIFKDELFGTDFEASSACFVDVLHLFFIVYNFAAC